MKNQRNLFFDNKPRKSPPKHGHNRPVPARRSRALEADALTIQFSDTTATQVGGYPLWDQFLRRAKLELKLAQHIKIHRGANGFTPPELSRFFIDTRVLGSARLMHVDRFRHDPMLVQSYGIDGLPSDETLGRYFNQFSAGHVASTDRLNVRLNNQHWKQARRQGNKAVQNGKIILDYDSSTMTVYGKQAGADRGKSFRKKDKPGFQPKFAFIGGLGVMVNQHLYPQSVNLDVEFDAFHKATLAKLPQTAKVWAFRADGALYSQARVRGCERRGYVYAISAQRNAALRDAMVAIPESAWVEGQDDRGHPYSVARIQYQPKTWDRARTFIVSRRLKDLKGQGVLWEHEQYRYFAYVTNCRGPVLDPYQFCVERCTLEAFIKEGKLGFQYHFLPCQTLDANCAYLSHVQMAYNLFTWWKLLHAPAGVNRWTVDTFRRQVLNICGNLTRRGGPLDLELTGVVAVAARV